MEIDQQAKGRTQFVIVKAARASKFCYLVQLRRRNNTSPKQLPLELGRLLVVLRCKFRIHARVPVNGWSSGRFGRFACLFDFQSFGSVKVPAFCQISPEAIESAPVKISCKESAIMCEF